MLRCVISFFGFVSICAAVENSYTALDNSAVLVKPIFERRSTPDTDVVSDRSESSPETVMPDREKIKRCVNQNNINDLIAEYHRVRDALDHDGGMWDAEISASFYPEEYITHYYGRSFNRLNEAARFCVLIAATYGHSTSRDIMMYSSPLIKENQTLVQNLCSIKERSSIAQRVETILKTPFSLNYAPNNDILLNEGVTCFYQILENIYDRSPIMIFNAGYGQLLRGELDSAYDLFMYAGEKGISAGYVEATGLIIRALHNRDIIIKGFSYFNKKKAASDKIKEILAGENDIKKWQLATYYRCGDIDNESGIDPFSIYYDIVKTKGKENPVCYYEYGLLNFEIIQAMNPSDEESSAVAKTVLSSFLMAMKYGVHAAYKKAEEAKKIFVERRIPDLSKLISQTDEASRTHSSLLSVLADEERVLIRLLMS